ncbi:cytochrome P450 [Vararia minispora EC-137]|uniref:Cytochrome P450 n=1 Tax=Vararia minispora EC-137 TaxID=1314806 RepID=A0ACB8QPS6_9AGAM|nr:cytochrome P450 [Vararia minispora EC-137]
MNVLSTFFKALVPFVVFVVYKLVQRAWRLHPLKRIPGPPSASFVTGNFSQWFGDGAIEFRKAMSERYGRVIGLNGLLGAKILAISDPLALQDILVKYHVDVFDEAKYFLEFNRVAIGPGLLASSGQHHRKQRKLLNPAFSTANIRRLVPTLQSITVHLQEILRSELGNGAKELDMSEYLGRLALESISQAGMGHSFRSLEGNDAGYGAALKSFVPAAARLHVWRLFLPYVTQTFPPTLLRFVAENVPWRAVRAVVEISDTMHVTTKEIWAQKKALYTRDGDKVMAGHGIDWKDIMSILIKANLEAPEADRLPDDELLAQMTTFLLAGTDTTSTALCRILHVLALHQDAQEKLREELATVAGEYGKVEHDTLRDLPYLEAVCRETLRLYPPAPLVQRDAQEDHILPLAHAIADVDGELVTEIFVPRGATVLVNIEGVNRDPGIWGPDAMEWRPERWLSPLPNSVADARVPGIYANTLTFLGGTRACIGYMFAQLEMKVVLSQLLSSFRFALPEREIIWRQGAIITPSVKGSDSNRPQLPLRVTLVK